LDKINLAFSGTGEMKRISPYYAKKYPDNPVNPEFI
jgi:hypothetical protein